MKMAELKPPLEFAGDETAPRSRGQRDVFEPCSHLI